jgi:hypothetical protein
MVHDPNVTGLIVIPITDHLPYDLGQVTLFHMPRLLKSMILVPEPSHTGDKCVTTDLMSTPTLT